MMLRGAFSSLLVLLACAVAVAVVPVRWLDAQLHTDDYAETVRPLPRDPQVQRAISDRLAEAIESSGREVPPVVATTIQSKVPVVLSTPEAAEIWVTTNMAAREALLSGNGGKVTVDIDELIAILSERLRAEGVDVPADLPAHSSRIVLVDSPAVARAREGSKLTTTLAQALPLVAGGLLLLGLLISARRFRTLAIAGIGVSVVAMVELLALRLARDRYLATVEDDTSRVLLDAAAQAFSRSLRSDLLVMLLAALAVAVGAIVLGILTRRRQSEGPDAEQDPLAAPPVQSDEGWPPHAMEPQDSPEAPPPYAGRPAHYPGAPPPYAAGQPPQYAGTPQRYAEPSSGPAEGQSGYAQGPPRYAERRQPPRPDLPPAPADGAPPRWNRPGGAPAERPPRQAPQGPGR